MLKNTPQLGTGVCFGLILMVEIMNFFDRQRYYKKRLMILYGLFFLVIAVHLGLAVFIFWYLDDKRIYRITFEQMFYVAFWFVMVFGLGYLMEYSHLSHGSRLVAKKLNAAEIIIGNPYLYRDINKNYDFETKCLIKEDCIVAKSIADLPNPYRQCYEIVEQLSIASGMPIPALFVLKNAQGINAMTLGYDDDLTMIITQGALDKLSQNSLYALIAYGYAKIIHGDSALNMQMLKVLSGLGMVCMVAAPTTKFLREQPINEQPMVINEHWMQKLVRDDDLDVDKQNNNKEDEEDKEKQNDDIFSKYKKVTRPEVYRSSNAKNPAGIIIVLMVAFSALFFGYWIRRFFHRSSVFLADATCLQLTRSDAIFEVLKEIEQDEVGSFVKNVSNYGFLFFDNPNHHQHLGGGFLFAYPSRKQRLAVLENKIYHQKAQNILSGNHDDLLTSISHH